MKKKKIRWDNICYISVITLVLIVLTESQILLFKINKQLDEQKKSEEIITATNFC